MALTKMTDSVNIIAQLDNYPPDDTGMTPDVLKAKFDEGSTRIKTFINGTLIPEIDAEETTRDTAEAIRKSNETARGTAESGRVTAENTRVTNENGRTSAESSRATAESNRASAESSRVTAENNRATAETNRASAESSRVTAENNRVTAENNRVTAEQNRAAFYDGFNTSISEFNNRVDQIITTPISGEAATQEVVDARGSFASVGARLINNDAFFNALNSQSQNKLPNIKPTWLTTFQSGHGWANPVEGGTTNLTDDTTEYIYGTQSLKVVNTGTAQKSGFALNLTGKALVVKFKVDALAAGQTVVVYAAETSSFAAYKTWQISQESANPKWYPYEEWVTVTLPWETGGGVGTPNRASIDTLRVKFSTGTVGNEIHVQAIGTVPVTSTGTVSFTFDDGWSSQKTGVKILAQRGIPSTIYAIPENLGKTNFLTLSELKSLHDDYDCDVEAHGGTTYTTLSTEQMRAEWLATRSFLMQNQLGNGEHLAWVGGQNNASTIAAAREFFASARSISYGSQLETYPPCMPYRLRAMSGVGYSGATVAQVQTAIDNAYASGHWLILVFHRIVTGTAADAMECSEADLITIANYAVSKGIQIKTVAEMCR